LIRGRQQPVLALIAAWFEGLDLASALKPTQHGDGSAAECNAGHKQTGTDRTKPRFFGSLTDSACFILEGRPKWEVDPIVCVGAWDAYHPNPISDNTRYPAAGGHRTPMARDRHPQALRNSRFSTRNQSATRIVVPMEAQHPCARASETGSFRVRQFRFRHKPTLPDPAVGFSTSAPLAGTPAARLQKTCLLRRTIALMRTANNRAPSRPCDGTKRPQNHPPSRRRKTGKFCFLFAGFQPEIPRTPTPPPCESRVFHPSNRVTHP